VSGLPKGLKLDATTGILHGTVSATKGTPGKYTVVVEVTQTGKGVHFEYVAFLPLQIVSP
jgi:hypothetical protein